MKQNATVDDYFTRDTPWEPTLSALRKLLLSAGLEETLKWRAPCYCLDGANVAILGRRKDHCVLSFFRGDLLTNTDNLLRPPGDHSRSVMCLSFTRADQIHEMESTIEAIIADAIEVQRSGRNSEAPAPVSLDLPVELTERFSAEPELATAFSALTPGRQRGYLIYFTGAKRADSRRSRIDRYAARILTGRGIHDCTCGLSKRMPRCDGSHKELRAGN